MHNVDSAGSGSADFAKLFEEVFRSHFSSLHGYAYSIVKDDVKAEEIVQDVFYRLWERREQIIFKSSVTSYLFRMVHNDCLNVLKHEKVKARFSAHINGISAKATHADPAEARELRQRIDKALGELPAQCRVVFHMSRNEELKYHAIADKMGISVKTVENHMGKALKLLRKKLADFLPIIMFLLSQILQS